MVSSSDDERFGRGAEGDQACAVSLAERGEHLACGLLVAIEGGGGIDLGRGRDAVVDEQVDAATAAAADEARGFEQRAAEGERDHRDDEAPGGEQDELLELEFAALLAVRLHEEAHRRPADGLAPLAHEQVDQDRDADGCEPGGEEPRVEEGHDLTRSSVAS